MKKIILSSLLVALTLKAGSCWNVKDDENSDFKELESSILISFRDAIDCKPISDAKVKIFGQEFATDKNGEFMMPTPPSELEIQDNLIASKDGYMSLNQTLSTRVGTFSNTKFLMTKQIPITKARAVLSWGENPKDLDLHIKSSDFHISFRNKIVKNKLATLDRDSTQGFGPETITINNLDKNKKYEVLVHNYTQNSKFESGANVSIYTNGELDKTIIIPSNINSDTRCLKVATIFDGSVSYKVEAKAESECGK